MNGAHVHDLQHRHGRRVHSHPHRGTHRHLTALKLSEPAQAPAQPHADHDQGHGHTHGHGGGHGHTHGLVDDSIKRSHEGIRAVLRSLAALALAGIAQTIVFVASGSIALLADLIHNFGDALTAVAGIEAVSRLVHPSAPTHLPALAFAGAIGYGGNLLAARVRTSAGRRLDSAALIADGKHARADAYVSLAVIASALVVATGLPIADPIIGLVICLVILRITWQSWRTVRDHAH
jgi:divalent metal cation (Fe/Co/Zn/Cd) transporter